MRVVNQQGNREPLQPLPAMQRPLTPPESQRHHASPKYIGGMARSEQGSKLQVASREEINLYDSLTESEEGEYYDFEEDGSQDGIGGTSTVKISGPSRLQEPSTSGWQVNNGVPPLRSPSPSRPIIQARSPSPSKLVAQSRSGSQVTTATPSRYAKSDGPARTSASSSTAVTHTSPSIPTFGANLPPRSAVKQPQRKYDALEDILLPALDEVSSQYPKRLICI